jgi:hypothetical protein
MARGDVAISLSCFLLARTSLFLQKRLSFHAGCVENFESFFFLRTRFDLQVL